MARQTKKRKYKKHASKVRKTIEKWMKKGNPNVKDYLLFLRAEQAALDKKYKLAEICYQDAIKIAARTGSLHHAGMYNERYADFLRQELGDNTEARYRITEAIRFYEEWGAEAKVKILRKSPHSIATSQDPRSHEVG